MAASNTAVYAVVDKSKKGKKHSLPQNEIAESILPNSFDSPVYDMADHSADTPPVPQRDEAFNSEYSMITLDNMYSTVNDNTRPRAAEQASGGATQGRSPAITTKKRRLEGEGTGCKLITCFFITIAVVATITLICLAILFVEVLKLKAKTTSTQLTSPDQQAANAANDFSRVVFQLQQLNETLSSIKEMQTENYRIEDHLNESVDLLERQLSMSLLQLGETNTGLRNDIHHLNSSIEMVQQDQETSTQELEQTLDNHIQQLNNSIEMVKLGQETSTQELERTLVNHIQYLNNSVEMVKLDQQKSNITIQALLSQIRQDEIGQVQTLPVSSCATLIALSPSSPSGYYWVRASNGSAVHVYCDMTRSCGGVTGGWMRVAELDMTNSSHQCPTELQLTTSGRTCRIASDSAECSQAITYSTISEYSKVCGKIRGFQTGTPDSFSNFGRGQNPTLDENYVDGISLTHGRPRQHIWTFAAYSSRRCSCADQKILTISSPSYVSNDYFCDTSTRTQTSTRVALWEENRCTNSNTCCSFNNPPWFHKQLLQSTTDDIEMRVCRDEIRANEDIYIQVIDIYVQ